MGETKKAELFYTLYKFIYYFLKILILALVYFSYDSIIISRERDYSISGITASRHFK